MDTARAYRNEAGVGEATARSGIDREELFIATKLWNADHGRDAAKAAFDQSLERLGYEYVDLFLIRWPLPSQDKYVETWQALCELHADGRARSIGVSNFQVEHLERIIDVSGVVPSVNQIELGSVVIPKSVTAERIEENFDLFDFELSEDHMEAIGQLEAGERTGPDPDTFDVT